MNKVEGEDHFLEGPFKWETLKAREMSLKLRERRGSPGPKGLAGFGGKGSHSMQSVTAVAETAAVLWTGVNRDGESGESLGRRTSKVEDREKFASVDSQVALPVLGQLSKRGLAEETAGSKSFRRKPYVAVRDHMFSARTSSLPLQRTCANLAHALLTN